MISASRRLQIVAECNRSAYNKRIMAENAKKAREIQKNGQFTEYDRVSGRMVVTSPDGNKYFSQSITTGTMGLGSSISLSDLTRNIPKIDGIPTV